MELNDWHVIQHKKTEQRRIIYGDIDTVLGPEEQRIEYIELPREQWTVAEILSVLDGLFTYIDKPHVIRFTKSVQKSIEEQGVPKSYQHEFFSNHIKSQFNTFGNYPAKITMNDCEWPKYKECLTKQS